MALLIKADGKKSEVQVPKGAEQLPFLQKLVGGFIQLANVAGQSKARKQRYNHVVCNEEGKMCNLPFNSVATEFAGYTSDFLVGDVLFVKYREVS